jgi:EAL domain-containing protein (putative c-di-GMP-specific phosphodiesterase class I)
MGMSSVAEGVETENDGQVLRELGCDLAQDCFMGRPKAAQRLPGWTLDGEARRTSLIGM